jgi:hypothetical protein
MIVPEFQNRLMLTFPPVTHDALVQALCSGIRKAETHIKDTPQFAGEVGLDLRGHLRRVFVLHEFQEASRLKRLPYEALPSKMPIGSWHWVNVRSGGMIAHVVRTETPDGFPDRTTNRQALSVTNQYDLLKDGSIPPVELIVTRAGYAYLTFGVDHAGTVTHISLGMPSSDNSHWLAFARLMRRSKPEPLIVQPPAPPTPPVASGLKFVPEVAQALDADVANDDKKNKSA